MRWMLPLGFLLGAGLLIWVQQGRQAMSNDTSLAFDSILMDSDDGFPRAGGQWSFRFPADHGGHPNFRSEVWYLTGNLEDEAGQAFGFQLAFFRLRLRSSTPERVSAWGAKQAFRAHFTLTDVGQDRFYATERFSRVALGLSGMDASPVRVWLEDWSLTAGAGKGGAGFHLRVGDGEDPSLRLDLMGDKPPVLPGAADLFDSGPGGGSFHFYSLSRLSAVGTLHLAGAVRKVKGEVWLDRAWGTVPMSQGQIALNRLALQLEDGRDLLCLQLRRRDGSGTPIPSCLLIGVEGAAKAFRRRDVRLESSALWRSKRTKTDYPLHWRLSLPMEGLDLEIDPQLEGQEPDFAIPVWSGSVQARGRSHGRPMSGRGHLELTGYVGPESGV